MSKAPGAQSPNVCGADGTLYVLKYGENSRLGIYYIGFRFNLWAKNNLALTDGLYSMDQRLRKSLIPRRVVLDLLSDLASGLEGMYGVS